MTTFFSPVPQDRIILKDKMTARHRISGRNVLVIGTWNFDIVWNLSIVIWNFSPVSGKSNRLYLNQFVVTLTFSCSMPHFSQQNNRISDPSPDLPLT